MSLIPILKAFDASSRSESYVFFCPYRKFPVIMQYASLKLLVDINDVFSMPSLLMMHSFDGFECGVHEEHAIGQLWHRGYIVSEVSRLTDMQPLEVAMYYSGIVAPDDETMRIILKRTGNTDIPAEPLKYVYGEPVSAF